MKATEIAYNLAEATLEHPPSQITSELCNKQHYILVSTRSKESAAAGQSDNAFGYRREENFRKALSLGSSTIPIKQNSVENGNIHNKFHGNNQ